MKHMEVVKFLVETNDYKMRGTVSMIEEGLYRGGCPFDKSSHLLVD